MFTARAGLRPSSAAGHASSSASTRSRDGHSRRCRSSFRARRGWRDSGAGNQLPRSGAPQLHSIQTSRREESVDVLHRPQMKNIGKPFNARLSGAMVTYEFSCCRDPIGQEGVRGRLRTHRAKQLHPFLMEWPVPLFTCITGALSQAPASAPRCLQSSCNLE